MKIKNIILSLLSVPFIIKLFFERNRIINKIMLHSYNLLGANISSLSKIQTKVRLHGIKNITIDSGSFVGSGSKFIAYKSKISIGKNCLIASDCIFITRSHVYLDLDVPIKDQGYVNKDIDIEDDVWLGFRVIVLPGVTVGKGSIVAANSVVNRDIPPFCIYGGIPAKLIKKREKQ